LLKNSKLTEKDAIRIGRKVNSRIAKRMEFSKEHRNDISGVLLENF
jgi:hypothetical protein